MSNKNKNKKKTGFFEVDFEIPCGDWIYEEPLYSLGGKRYLLRLHQQEKDKVDTSNITDISKHLHGPRYIKCRINWYFDVLKIFSLLNKEEEDFIEELRYTITFNEEDLFSKNVQGINRFQVVNAVPTKEQIQVIFTSILLQNFLDGKDFPYKYSFEEIKWCLRQKDSFCLFLFF